ncbi:uncharacterized protein LOC120337177 isoform X2 [Styela clava]
MSTVETEFYCDTPDNPNPDRNNTFPANDNVYGMTCVQVPPQKSKDNKKTNIKNGLVISVISLAMVVALVTFNIVMITQMQDEIKLLRRQQTPQNNSSADQFSDKRMRNLDSFLTKLTEQQAQLNYTVETILHLNRSQEQLSLSIIQDSEVLNLKLIETQIQMNQSVASLNHSLHQLAISVIQESEAFHNKLNEQQIRLNQYIEITSSLNCSHQQLKIQELFPKDCTTVFRKNAKTQNNSGGVFDIYPESSDKPFEVYCDLVTDGGGWTVCYMSFKDEWTEQKTSTEDGTNTPMDSEKKIKKCG